jgi:hypothetical protein
MPFGLELSDAFARAYPMLFIFPVRKLQPQFLKDILVRLPVESLRIGQEPVKIEYHRVTHDSAPHLFNARPSLDDCVGDFQA